MNAGNVASFACARPHPQLGERVVCTRQRHHAGDHRAEHAGSLKVWPDAPAAHRTVDPFPEFEGPPMPRHASLTVPLSDPIPGELDEDAETWSIATEFGPLPWAWWLLLGVFVVFLVAAPALVVIAYRQAF